MVLIALHINNNHWGLGIYDIPGKVFGYFNSMHQPHHRDLFFRAPRSLLARVHQECTVNSELNLDEWTDIDYSVTWTMKQESGYSVMSGASSSNISSVELGNDGQTIMLSGIEYSVKIISERKCSALRVDNGREYDLFLYPRQIQCDCGIFTMKAAEFICSDLHPDFEESDMAYFRKRICVQCVLSCLD